MLDNLIFMELIKFAKNLIVIKNLSLSSYIQDKFLIWNWRKYEISSEGIFPPQKCQKVLHLQNCYPALSMIAKCIFDFFFDIFQKCYLINRRMDGSTEDYKIDVRDP